MIYNMANTSSFLKGEVLTKKCNVLLYLLFFQVVIGIDELEESVSYLKPCKVFIFVETFLSQAQI